ncbi:MAG: GNAT family N-acetyltransferase [Acidobacteriota bacterium]
MPRLIQEGDLTLRPLRIWDGPFLSRMLMREDILRSCGLRRPIEIPWFSLYRWLKAMFPIAYRIEYASEAIGFVGLCNLRHDQSAEMSLMIFKSSCRRIGLGTAAFRLLSAALEGNHLVKRWVVSVRRDNAAAYAFWRKLGFEDVWQDGETVRMTLSAGKQGTGRKSSWYQTVAENIFMQGNA